MATSAVALALPAGVAQADPLAPPLTLAALPVVTPESLAVGQELLDFLSAKAGGEAALFKLVTGADAMLSQTLTLQLVPGQFSTGDMVYDNALMKVASRTSTVSNCGSTIAPSMSDTRQGTYTTQANWSTARSQTGTRAHSVSVTAGYSAMGFSLKTSYSFTDTQSSTAQNSQGTQVENSTQWATQQTFQAALNTTAVMRHDVVSVTGGPNGVQYTLSPSVRSGATLNFVVATAGIDARKMVSQIFESNGPQSLGFGNPAAPNSSFAAADKAFPAGALLWSADGRYVYGREIYWKDRVSSQVFSIVDLARTTSAASPWRLMSFTCEGMKSPQHLGDTVLYRHYTVGHVLSANGAAQWTCDGRVTSAIGSVSGPCRYISFLGTDGRLACFDQDVSRMAPTEAQSHVTGWLQSVSQPALASQNQVIYTQYQVPMAAMQSALNLPGGDVNLTLTGQFTGEHQVYDTKCLQAYPMDYDPTHGRCAPQKGNRSTERSVCPDTATTLRRFKKKTEDVVFDVRPDTSGAPVANTQ